MIDNIWGIFTIGLLLGAPSGIAPGPMLILIISETLRHSIHAGAKVAFIPLLTDIPVVLISGFLFAQISNMNILLGAISLFGSVFLLYLGTNSIRTATAEILNLTPRSLRLTYILKNRQKIIACNPS
jgi:threonine/homoserine/homoserine lactone efflux protein